jgi:hypothetical protein
MPTVTKLSPRASESSAEGRRSPAGSRPANDIDRQRETPRSSDAHGTSLAELSASLINVVIRVVSLPSPVVKRRGTHLLIGRSPGSWRAFGFEVGTEPRTQCPSLALRGRQARVGEKREPRGLRLPRRRAQPCSRGRRGSARDPCLQGVSRRHQLGVVSRSARRPCTASSLGRLIVSSECHRAPDTRRYAVLSPCNGVSRVAVVYTAANGGVGP